MSERIRSREKFKLSSSVFIFMLDGDNILLLLRENTGWLDGYYSVPGGMKESKEVVHLAALRELKEEVGVIAEPSDLQKIHFMHCFTTGEEWYGIFYVLTKWQGVPSIQEPHKHKELLWVPIAELPQKMSPYILQAIHCYQKQEHSSDFGWELGLEASGEDYVNYYTYDKLK